MLYKHNQPILNANSIQPYWLETRTQRVNFLFLTDTISFLLTEMFVGQSIILLWTLYMKIPFFTTSGYYFISYVSYFIELIEKHNYFGAFMGIGGYIFPAFAKLMVDGIMVYIVFAFHRALMFTYSSFPERIKEKKKHKDQSHLKSWKILEKIRQRIVLLRKTRIMQFLKKSSRETEQDHMLGIGIKFYTDLSFSVSRMIIGGMLIGPIIFVLQALIFVLFRGLISKSWSFNEIILFQDTGFLVFYLTESIMIGLLFTLAAPNISADYKIKTTSKSEKFLPSYQKIVDLISRAMELGVYTGLFSCIIVGIISSLLMGIESGVVLGISAAFSFGYMAFWLLGGNAATRHLVVRLILFWKKYIPWSYEDAFENLSNTSIIINTGEGFMFAHPSIQEYFRRLRR